MATLNKLLQPEDVDAVAALDRPLSSQLFCSDWDQGFTINIDPRNLDKVIEICEKIKLAARNKNLPQIDFAFETYYKSRSDYTRVKHCVFRVALPACNLGPYRVICRMDYKESLQQAELYKDQKEEAIFTPYVYTYKGFPIDAIPESILNGSCPPNCEHCDVNRFRNETYLIFNTVDQTFKQIGSTCVDQYTGIDHAASQLKYFALLEKFKFAIVDYEERFDYDGDKEPDDSARFGEWVPLEDLLAITQAVVKKAGRYFSKDAAAYEGETPTADAVLEIIKGYKRLPDCDYSELLKNSENIKREVLSACNTMSNREYAHNLALSLKHEMISVRKIGVACSAVAVWFRNVVAEQEKKARMERGLQASAASSESSLKAGDKLEKELRITKMKDSFRGRFPSTLVIMLDDKNLEYKWSASSPPRNFAPNTAYTAKMTISGFEEYQGVPQRVVTRVSFPDLNAVNDIADILHSSSYSKSDLYKELDKIKNLSLKVLTKGDVVHSWVNNSIFANASAQSIYDLFNHKNVLPHWKQLSQDYGLLGDKSARPSLHALLFREAIKSEVYHAGGKGKFIEIDGQEAGSVLRKLAADFHDSGAFYLNKFNADEKSIVEKTHLMPFIRELLGEYGADVSYLANMGSQEEIKAAFESLQTTFKEIGKSVVLPSLLTKDFSNLAEPIIGIGKSTNRLFVYDRQLNERLKEASTNRFKVPALYDLSGEPYYAVGKYIGHLSYDRLQSVADAAAQHGYPPDYMPGHQLSRLLATNTENTEAAKVGGLSVG